MKVILSSNVWHYHHAAEALDRVGWLERYVTTIVPLGRRSERALPEFWSEKLRARKLPAGISERTVSLTLPELAQKAGVHSRILSASTSVWLQNMLFDRLAARYVARCDVFHHVTSVGLHSARRARRLGAAVVADERQEHPDAQREAVARELGALGLPVPASMPRWQSTLDAELRQADFILVGSEYAKETFVNRGFCDDRVYVVPYGFDPQLFRPRNLRKAGLFSIIFCGQITPRKGVHHLVRAFAGLALDNAELVLVGAVDPILEPLARKWARIPGVRLVGEVPKVALPDIYAEASVFVLPSVADAQPLACLEAMACELPAIVTTAMGSREIVRDGVDGFVIQPGEVETLQDRLALLHGDPARLGAMRSSAFDRAHAFTWDAYGDRLVAAYSRMFSHARELKQ